MFPENKRILPHNFNAIITFEKINNPVTLSYSPHSISPVVLLPVVVALEVPENGSSSIPEWNASDGVFPDTVMGQGEQSPSGTPCDKLFTVHRQPSAWSPDTAAALEAEERGLHLTIIRPPGLALEPGVLTERSGWSRAPSSAEPQSTQAL